MISVLYKRGAAGELDARLSGAFGYESLALAKEEPCLIESGKRFYTSSPHPSPSTLSLFPLPSGMRKSPDVSPRRLSDISPQLRQLKYLVVDEAIKEDLKSSRSVEDINSASIEERILRITGYYGYQPWRASHTSESLHTRSVLLCVGGWVDGAKCYLKKVFLKSILVIWTLCWCVISAGIISWGGGIKNPFFPAEELHLLINMKGAKQQNIKSPATKPREKPVCFIRHLQIHSIMCLFLTLYVCTWLRQKLSSARKQVCTQLVATTSFAFLLSLSSW